MAPDRPAPCHREMHPRCICSCECSQCGRGNVCVHGDFYGVSSRSVLENVFPDSVRFRSPITCFLGRYRNGIFWICGILALLKL